MCVCGVCTLCVCVCVFLDFYFFCNWFFFFSVEGSSANRRSRQCKNRRHDRLSRRGWYSPTADHHWRRNRIFWVRKHVEDVQRDPVRFLLFHGCRLRQELGCRWQTSIHIWSLAFVAVDDMLGRQRMGSLWFGSQSRKNKIKKKAFHFPRIVKNARGKTWKAHAILLLPHSYPLSIPSLGFFPSFFF